MKVNRRERIAIFIALGFIFLYVLFQFAIFPYMDKRRRLENSLQLKSRSLQEILLLKSEYDMLTEKFSASEAQIRKREQGFTLYSFLEKVADAAGVKDKIVSMNPLASKPVREDSPYKLSAVEVKLQDLTLRQLTPYLHMIEISDNIVFIRNVKITKTDRKKGYVDVLLQVETYDK